MNPNDTPLWNASFREELEDIDKRRIGGKPATPDTLVGLAFSGGGIRSATFGLGVLEALKKLELLKQVHYLSTVSGGGYIGGWLSANCHRTSGWLDEKTDWLESIKYLRRHSNYLSPKVGFFSADTWSVATIWIRNTLLIQLMVILAIACALLPARPLLQGFQSWPDTGGWRWTTIVLFLIAVVGIAGNHSRLTRTTVPWFLGGRHWLNGLLASSVFLAAAMVVKRTSGLQPFADGPILILPAVLFSALLVALAFCFQPVGVGVGGWLYSVFTKGPRPAEVNYTQFWVQFAIVVPLIATGFLVAAVLWGQSRAGALSGLDSFSALFCTSWRYWPFPLAVVFVSLWLLSLCGVRRLSGDAPYSRWDRAKPWLTAVLAPAPAVFILYVLLCAIRLLLHRWAGDPGPGAQLAFVAAPALVLYAFSLSINILNGMMGRESTEGVREWWSRLGAWMLIYGVAWMAITLAAVYGPALAHKIIQWRPWTLGAGWLGTTLAGLLAGNSGSTDGQGKRLKRNKLLEAIAMAAPFVFIAGLLITISSVLDWIIRLNSGQDWSSIGAFHQDPSRFLIVSLVVLTVCLLSLLLLAARVDINEFSLSAFYRNRLVRCYLGATRPAEERRPQNFTGFDEEDDIKLAKLRVGHQKTEGPFHIVNCALNLGGSSDLALHTRHSAAFTMTPIRCGSGYFSRERTGSARELGYISTDCYGSESEAPTLGQAIAVSGAAASPNMGYHTSPVVAFLLTVFNIRLGWWCPNPKRGAAKFSSPHFALTYLFAELFGSADDKSRFLNVSDGGHFENLAAYELVRRKCRVIVISDGECDLDLNFEGLGRLIRMCDVDFGAKITIDVRPIHVEDEKQWSERQFAVGTIDYRDGSPQGILIYLKASMTDGEGTAVRQYKASHPAFPHESTGNQFYKEDQFESYRRLGLAVATSAFKGVGAGSVLERAQILLIPPTKPAATL